MNNRKTPETYREAIGRAVLPAEDTGIGLSFDFKDGDTVRIFLDLNSALSFCQALQEALERHRN